MPHATRRGASCILSSVLGDLKETDQGKAGFLEGRGVLSRWGPSSPSLPVPLSIRGLCPPGGGLSGLPQPCLFSGVPASAGFPPALGWVSCMHPPGGCLPLPEDRASSSPCLPPNPSHSEICTSDLTKQLGVHCPTWRLPHRLELPPWLHATRVLVDDLVSPPAPQVCDLNQHVSSDVRSPSEGLCLSMTPACLER